MLPEDNYSVSADCKTFSVHLVDCAEERALCTFQKLARLSTSTIDHFTDFVLVPVVFMAR